MDKVWEKGGKLITYCVLAAVIALLAGAGFFSWTVGLVKKNVPPEVGRVVKEATGKEQVEMPRVGITLGEKTYTLFGGTTWTPGGGPVGVPTPPGAWTPGTPGQTPTAVPTPAGGGPTPTPTPLPPPTTPTPTPSPAAPSVSPTPTPTPTPASLQYGEAAGLWVAGDAAGCTKVLADAGLTATTLYAWSWQHAQWLQELQTALASGAGAREVMNICEKILWGEEEIPGNGKVALARDAYGKARDYLSAEIKAQYWFSALKELSDHEYAAGKRDQVTEDALVVALAKLKTLGGTFRFEGFAGRVIVPRGETNCVVVLLPPDVEWLSEALRAEVSFRLWKGFLDEYAGPDIARGAVDDFKKILALSDVPEEPDRLRRSPPPEPQVPAGELEKLKEAEAAAASLNKQGEPEKETEESAAGGQPFVTINVYPYDSTTGNLNICNGDRVRISGKTLPGYPVKVTVDGRFLKFVTADDAGAWEMDIENFTGKVLAVVAGAASEGWDHHPTC